ncbi:mediator of RNA polymerase II transcription subunit 16 [Neocloeon triangulifer]|uniref:mediator of RNA polymerase II transcription subunit 16 n=1 Tax=Neocloeon triangulifer TaxID=2078957 RepID=UPI00286EF8C4|nr:mediator of RNA polymerase II transcription subunit 16 [Neocloeon triangulifer]
MDIVYSVSCKQVSPSKYNNNADFLHEGPTLCSISSRNVVAFTTTTELNDQKGITYGSHVYVADLNCPWHSYKIISHDYEITSLEWDLPGSKLLVADSNGLIQIFASKEHLLNDWSCLVSAHFPGEQVLAASFFHNGRKIGLVAEKKDNPMYIDKFAHVKFAPTVRHFGGQPLEGCVFVTSTGMVGVVTLVQEGMSSITKTLDANGPNYNALTASESLGNTRQRVMAVDICYGKNGQFLVAVTSGKANLPIQCYRVSIKRLEDKMSIMSQALPSFFLQCSTLKDNSYHQVVQLRFVVREDADSLVVTANSETGGIVEIWELREKVMSVHKVLQKSSSPPPEPFKMVVWQHQSHWQASSNIRAVCTTKASLSTAVPTSTYIMVALNDSKLFCLHRDSLKQIASATLSLPWRCDEPSPKMSRGLVNAAAMDLTWAGSGLLVADTRGQLYLFKVLPVADPGGAPLTVPYAVTLLEYCLISGMDWWDVLLALRPSMIDAVCDRFTESFIRQPASTQQILLAQYLCIKASLHKLSSSGQQKSSDLLNLIMLHSISTAFKSLLRPSDLVNHEKSPADSISMAMTEPLADINRVLLIVEPKECTVEPSTLQSLQQLIQWVADLALNLLARIPEQRQQRSLGLGYELLRDISALNELRELLVIIKIWGLLRPTCLPVFIQMTDNLDVLSLCFKLLSRLVQSPDPDEALVDECLLLPSQVKIPQINSSSSTAVVMAPALFYHPLPIQLEFGTEPENLQTPAESNPVEGALQTQQVIDCIRHIYLGKSPLIVRVCCRCGGMSQAQTHNSLRLSAAIKAWDQRWIKSCRCGGAWRLHKFSLY